MSDATPRRPTGSGSMEPRKDPDARALWFERIDVRRMPGIEGAGFTLDGLALGINIVHGPNGSGKTTTARAIEALLWPRSAAVPRAILEGRFRVGEEGWRVEVEGAHARHLLDGREASAPSLPPAETRDRYRLSLHELLRSENEELASEIVRESAGGYDLARAAEGVHRRDGPPRRGRETAALDEARRKLRLALGEQESIFEEERRLRELAEKVEAAETAERRVLVLRRAVEHAEAVAAEAEARAAVEAFPPEMAGLRGDEATRLETIRGRIDETRRRLDDAERDRGEAETELEASGLPAEGVGQDTVASLRHRREEVRDLDAAIATHDRELAGERAVVAEELRRIGEVVDEAALPELDIVDVDELASFAEEAGAARAAVLAAEERLRVLEAREGTDEATKASATGRTRQAGSASVDPERLNQGIWVLRQWLRAGGAEEAQGPASRLRIPAAFLSILPALAAVYLSGAGLGVLAGVIVSFALVIALLWPRGSGSESREARKRDYAALELEAPRSWTEAGVVERLDGLEALRAEVRLAEARAADRRAVAAEIDAARERWLALEEKRAALAARFGVSPELDPAALHAFVNRLARWQDAASRVEAMEAERKRLRDERAARLGEAAAILARFGYADVADLARLVGAIDELEARIGRHAKALERRARAKSLADDSTTEIERLEAERRGILDRVGWGTSWAKDEATSEATGEETDEATDETLGPDPDEAEAALRGWCARHSDYEAAVGRLREAMGARASARARLAEAPGYAPGLESEPIGALREEMTGAEERASRLAALREESAGIHARIDVARRGHAVEDALAEVDRCEAALGAVRDRDILGVVGSLLVAHVQRATRDQHRPEVFHRARSLFSVITNGRYRLDFEEGESSSFRAFDEEAGTSHALDELSSATRVQLLLAVRLAFVESREGGARLPIVFDETLGNSDDARAAAIIDATVALAAEGRQVFYFTAQPDEVAKWRGVLERRSEIASSVIDLAAVRRLARHEAAPELLPGPAPAPTVEPPNGRDRDEYGRALRVPGLGPNDEISGVHLWHLVDDPDRLHRLLSLGFESWGQLRSLVEHGGRALLGADAEAFPGIEALARALETALGLVRIGRGRAVDREAIAASGAVTDTFMDRAVDLAEEVNGSAARLIQAIEDGALPRFRVDSRERLREYLVSHGHLDPRDPLSADEVQARVLAAVAAEVGDGRLDRAAVDRVLRQLLGAVAA